MAVRRRYNPLTGEFDRIRIRHRRPDAIEEPWSVSRER